MNRSNHVAEPERARDIRRVLILADESADWKIAGLRQLDRLALTLNEFAGGVQRLSVCVFWKGESRWLPAPAPLANLELTDQATEFLADESAIDLVLSTHVFLYRDSIPELLTNSPAPAHVTADGLWQSHLNSFSATFPARLRGHTPQPWRFLSSRREIPSCERSFLRHNGKSQDGLVSRHLNRRISRWLSRRLLQLPLTPSTWSALIFALPLAASIMIARGTYSGFIIGCAVYQLYSILDGCDGEIARAKFLQSEFGRRLDSFCDLLGNMLLAVSLGVGLARQAHEPLRSEWFYLAEGIAAAVLIATSEGIVFARRTRGETGRAPSGRWNGALYQRHHEFLERSGILVLGEKFAWWLVQLTKRDMAMLAFLLLAILGWPAGILHLLFAVAGVSSVLAGNAFLRQPAPAVTQEAS